MTPCLYSTRNETKSQTSIFQGNVVYYPQERIVGFCGKLHSAGKNERILMKSRVMGLAGKHVSQIL